MIVICELFIQDAIWIIYYLFLRLLFIIMQRARVDILPDERVGSLHVYLFPYELRDVILGRVAARHHQLAQLMDTARARQILQVKGTSN